MEYFLYFAIIFTIVFLVYFFLINRRRVRKKQYQKMGEVNYLIKKFRLRKDLIDYKSLALIVSFANSFIIAFVCAAISAIPLELMWQLLIGFVLLFALIYAVYEIIGRSLVKKGWGQNV